MVFLRSEEHLTRWLASELFLGAKRPFTGLRANGDPPLRMPDLAQRAGPGASLTATKLNELARRWWWTRLEPDWRPRPVAESQAILDELGLTGDFWRLI